MSVDRLLTTQLITVESPMAIYTALVSHIKITAPPALRGTCALDRGYRPAQSVGDPRGEEGRGGL